MEYTCNCSLITDVSTDRQESAALCLSILVSQVEPSLSTKNLANNGVAEIFQGVDYYLALEMFFGNIGIRISNTRTR